MPAEYHIDFLFKSYVASELYMYRWIDELIRRCHPSNNFAEDLRRASRLIVQGAKRWLVENHQLFFYRKPSPFTDHLLGKVMYGCLYLNDRKLCCEALSALQEQLPHLIIVDLIKGFGFTELKSE